MKGRLDHIGVAVRDLDEAAAFYSLLGLELAGVEDHAAAGQRIGFLRAGESSIELLEPLSPDSVIGRFIERRGEGLHHICIEVDDLASELDKLAAEGIELIDRQPRQGAEGMIAFVHPRSCHGVLVELIQKVRTAPGSPES